MTNSIMSKTLMAVAAVALTTVSFANTASAENRTTRSVEVSFADLDLNSEDGKATFRGRIKGAIRQVCGGYDSRNLVDSQDHANCMDEAQQSASGATVTILAAAEAGELTQTNVSVGR